MSLLERAGRRAASLRRHLLQRAFAGRLELDTDGEVWPDELGLPDQEYLYYAPSQWPTVAVALRDHRPTRDDVFIDIGSGKGRVVVQAARHPFRRVIGVEISEDLNEIARRNVERNRARLACDVELVTADLLEYRLPDDVTMAYCYNALAGRAFQGLMEHLSELADRRRSPVLFIYSNPQQHEAVMAGGRARLLRRHSGRRPLRFPLHIYEIAPAGEPPPAH